MNYVADRGFVTVATGKRYVDMAVNLVKSYRYHTKDPLPFSLITDGNYENNKYFDDVIVLSECRHNTLDKIEIIVKSPYEKTIFIESDILLYRDANVLFDYFKDAGPFSVFGRLCDVDCDEGFFKKSELPSEFSNVGYGMIFHGGIYYIDNKYSDILSKLYDTTLRVISVDEELTSTVNDNVHRYGHFLPDDETVLAVSMALVGCKPTFPNGEVYSCTNKYICVYPYCHNYQHRYKCDVSKGILEYDFEGNWVDDVILLHFGNYYTKKYLYNREVYRLDNVTGKTNSKSFLGLTFLFAYEKARNVLAFFKHKVFNQ